MARDARQPDGLAGPTAPDAPVVVSGDHVCTAGQVALDGGGVPVGGPIEEQTRQALENVRLCLEAAGWTFDDVVKVSAFLTDLANFEGFNAVYREAFSEPFPVRTTVQVGLPSRPAGRARRSRAPPVVSALQVETPAAVVDLDRLERNLVRWQEHCDRVGLANRPHVKTHRSVAIARRQLDLGARGITCQKLGEAEVMADAGCTDILVSYNILGESKLARLRALLDRVDLTVCADDAVLLPGLSSAAAGATRPLRVLVDCDTGLGRTGVATPRRRPSSPRRSTLRMGWSAPACSRTRRRRAPSSSSPRLSPVSAHAGSRSRSSRRAERRRCGPAGSCGRS